MASSIWENLFLAPKILTLDEIEFLNIEKDLPLTGVMLHDVFNDPIDSLEKSDLVVDYRDKGYDASDKASVYDNMPIANKSEDSDDEPVGDDEDGQKDEEDICTNISLILILIFMFVETSLRATINLTLMMKIMFPIMKVKMT